MKFQKWWRSPATIFRRDDDGPSPGQISGTRAASTGENRFDGAGCSRASAPWVSSNGRTTANHTLYRPDGRSVEATEGNQSLPATPIGLTRNRIPGSSKPGAVLLFVTVVCYFSPGCTSPTFRSVSVHMLTRSGGKKDHAVPRVSFLRGC